jgi:hypothetical protein
MKSALALGCSHTAGVGVEPHECYVTVLSHQLGLTIINLAEGGGNSSHVQDRLVEYLRYNRPEFVILQWPNIFRRTTWIKGRPVKENVNHASQVFHAMMTAGPENFTNPWLMNVITCNRLCDLARVPAVNILLESLDSKNLEILHKQDIVMHCDDKTPTRTWLFDGAGSDNMHHSARCHAQWAERLKGLLDEITT